MKLSDELKVALRWWYWVLQHDIVEERLWGRSEERPSCMFVDARSTPARCAAVLITAEGEILYTDGPPSKKVMERFKQREDKQIMTLEVLAIAVGLATFAHLLKNKKVIVFSDNTGAEAATKKGCARSWDHCNLIHEIWTQALCNRTHIWLERVPTKDNLADLPSREQYDLLCKLGAVWVEPKLASLYCETGCTVAPS